MRSTREIVATFCVLALAALTLFTGWCRAAALPGSATCRSSCQHSSPVTSLQSSPPEEDYALAIRCQALCIEKYGIQLPNTTTYPVWPTVDIGYLQEDCHLYQKVEQCQIGCTLRYEDPTQTANECRDSCYATCQISCGGQTSCTVTSSPCVRECRKTFCKQGCKLPDETETLEGPAPPSPLAAPTLIQLASQNKIGYFSVSLPGSGVPTIQNWGTGEAVTGPVTFLFKVVDPQEAVTRFYWQSDLSQTLKLTAFVCREVEVAFAVVSNANISHYSPATTVCVHENEGLPSQVNIDTIEFSTVEDTRSQFEGYAVTTMSWEKPEGYQFLTSYTILVVSTKSECGGEYAVHQLGQLGSDATQFTFRASGSSKWPKFGCTYHVELEAHPPLPSNGTKVLMTPQLTGPPPNMTVGCESIWNKRGLLEVQVNWLLPNSALLVKAIEEFQVSQQPNYGKTQKIPTEENKYQYNVTFLYAQPPVQEDGTLRFLVKPLKNSVYWWRIIPDEEVCTVFAVPSPPAAVRNVTVKNFHSVSSRRLSFDVSWLPNEDTISSYEILVTKSEILVSAGSELAYSLTAEASQTMTHIELFSEQSETAHCLYLWVRAYLGQYPGNVSTPLILPRDSDCKDASIDYSFEETKDSDSQITVYYRSDNSTSKLVDITCSNGVQDLTNSTYNEIDVRLQKLEERLVSISDYLGVNGSEPLDDRLEAMEQKMDTIIDLLTSNLQN